MSSSVKALEPAFQGAGQRVGTEIWRIENFQPVPLPKPDHGKFFSGDSYIVLQTSPGKGGAYLYDIHFWLGKDTSQDEAGTAAIKTIELDAVLGGRAVQHRELQSHESDKFLSYFKPCIMPMEGGVVSGFKTPEEDKFETRLYVCKGKRAVRLKQVPFSRSTLNHDDVFILDTEEKIYQFNGANSNIQERAKALEVIQFFKDNYHEGTCNVAIVDDGKLQAEGDSGEFWELFGGFAPIGKKIPSEDDILPERIAPTLYSILGIQVNSVDAKLSKSLLESKKCYILDCGAEVFVWVGRAVQVDERKAAIKVAEEFVASQNRPKSTRITRVMQGYETREFKSNFDSWPSGSVPSGAEEGRGKVAAFLKQQGGGVKAANKGPQVKEEVPPLLEGGGKLEVWHVSGGTKTPVPKEDLGKFYSGDCYIILYSYHSHEKREDHYLCYWIGKDSVEEDHTVAAKLADSMSNSLKKRPLLGRVFQGKEPPQFVAIFQPMVLLKGGTSAGYKNYIADKGLKDETYTDECVALIQISTTSVHNNKSVQVDAVASSLNSYDCFLLQSGSVMFSWDGRQSTIEHQQLVAKVAEFLKPGGALKHTKEGTENSAFWSALGEKQSYTSKSVPPEAARDPHLFSVSTNKGKFEVEEIYNFSQDDLLSEDVLILDTHAEVFVWVGQSTNPKEKQNVFELGEKYIEMAAALDGLSRKVPLYKVTEGNEPAFFTTYFSWDHAKAIAQGNSFQKKVMQLFGTGLAAEEKSNGSLQGGATQRASALAALNSAFSSSPTPKPTNTAPQSPSTNGATQRASALAALNSAFSSSPTPKPINTTIQSPSTRGSQRAAAVAALSQVLNAGPGSPDASPGPQGRGSSIEPKSPVIARSDGADEGGHSRGSPAVKESPLKPAIESVLEQEQEQDDNVSESGQSTFSYDQLKSKSENPVTGIDFRRREAYLSEDEFQTVFDMSKQAFNNLPKWKQDMLKKKYDLF